MTISSRERVLSVFAHEASHRFASLDAMLAFSPLKQAGFSGWRTDDGVDAQPEHKSKELAEK